MDHFSVTSVHPATIKHALKGHPWITKDHLSSQWPKNTLLLHVKLAPQKIYTYLHDPQHPFCVARLIHTEKITTLEEWQKLIEQRMENAIKKRQELTALKNRNHYWLIFAEADLLPGLYIVYLNGHILIQTHMAYWNERIKDVISTLEYVFQRLAFTYSSFWWQTRSQGQQVPLLYQDHSFQQKTLSFWVEEAGVKVRIDLGQRYDCGIYTDMSGIRQKILERPNFFPNKSVLNLFSYTGAYSIIALKYGAQYCCSLDSSRKYLQILEENLKENNLATTHHKTFETDIFKGLKHFQEKQNQFDSIILDPPSSFTSQGKKVQTFQIYPEMLKETAKVASPKANLLCFLNHHQKTRSQFESMVTHTLPQWRVVQHWELCDDSPLLSYFPEGDYLKGILLERK